MKKLLLSLLSMAAVVFAASAAEPTTIQFTNGSTAYDQVGAYNMTWHSADGMWEFYAFNNNNNGWDFIAAGWNKDTSTPYFATAKPSDYAINTIVATFASTRFKRDQITSATLLVADNANFTDATPTDITSLIPAEAGSDMTIKVENAPAGSFVKVQFEIPKQQSKNGQVMALTKIAINYTEVAGDKKPAGISYSASSVEVNANDLDKFEAPVLNNPNNLALTYTSSDENVAEVNKEGVVTLTGDEGEAVITAEFAGDDTYRAGKASYTIVVKNVPLNESTVDNPYTVAKALELAKSLNASTGIEDTYIKGYIVAITEVSTSFGNATYTIADAADATEVLTVFRGYYLNGAKFTAEDQIKEGAEVVVFGKLINYQGNTPELAQGNKIISYNYEGGDTPVELEKVNSINATFALEAGTKFIVNYPLTVAFVHGNNILLCDEAGDFIQIYLQNNLDKGDVLPAGWEATYGVRNGVPQLTPANGLPEVSDKVTFTPAVVAAADVTPAIVNHVVTVNGVVFAEATPATAENFTGTVDDVTLNFRNNYSVASVEAGVYAVTFWVNLYKGKPSLYVISYEKSTTSGIDDIAADSADAVFYNLQGVKVANPENGLYIRVAGGQVSKVLVK